MSTSVPDGISFADLEKLAKDAPDDSSADRSSPKVLLTGLNEDQS